MMDASALHTLDSFLGSLLHDITMGANLLGAQAIITGMQPAVAMTLVELGLDLKGVRTALDAEAGLRLLGVRVDSRNGH